VSAVALFAAALGVAVLAVIVAVGALYAFALYRGVAAFIAGLLDPILYGEGAEDEDAEGGALDEP